MNGEKRYDNQPLAVLGVLAQLFAGTAVIVAVLLLISKIV